MRRYSVIITVDASVTVEVDAENEEQAKELAMEQASHPCICHQCSNEIDIGDLQDAIEATDITGRDYE
jgi:hypothetical protein